MNAVKKFLTLLNVRAFYTFFLPFIAMLSALHNVFYQSNDDQAMRLILEGRLFSPKEPSEYVIFINVIYARFLKYLYNNFGNFFWYDISFYALIFTSSCVIAYLLFVKNEKTALKILISVFLFISFRLAFNQIQFSIVAGMLACSAVVSLIRLLFYAPSRKETIFSLFYIPAALLLSSLVRIEMTGLTLLTGGALCLVLIKRLHFSKTLFLTAFSVATGLLAVAGAYSYHRAEYGALNMPFNPLLYNETKSRILDKAIFNESEIQAEPYLKAAEPVLAKNGWSRNDLELFLNWGFTARGFFDLNGIRKIADNVAPLLQGSLKERLKPFFDGLSSCERYLHLIVLLMLLFTKEKSVRVKIVAAHLIFLCVFLGLAPFFKPVPVRVYFSLNLLEFCFLAFLVRDDFRLSNAAELLNGIKAFIGLRADFSEKEYARILFALLIGSVVYLYPKYVHDIKISYRLYKRASLPQTSDILFIPNYYLFRGSVLPFRPLKKGIENILIGPGWTVATPTFQKQFDGEYYELLLSGKIRFLDFYHSRPYFAIERFWKEHYGKNCRIEIPETRNTPDDPIITTYIDCR